MHKHISPHGDENHIGTAINLVNNFKVEKVIFNCGDCTFVNDVKQNIEEIELYAKRNGLPLVTINNPKGQSK